MSLDYWALVLIIVVVVMAETLRLVYAGRRRAEKGSLKSGPGSSATPISGARANFSLAPRDPEVMTGALFELLSQKLNYEQLKAFAGLVASAEMTDRYLARLATGQSTGAFARSLAFLCESMKVNGFTDQQRALVSAALERKADKEYKLLTIHKNLDKIL